MKKADVKASRLGGSMRSLVYISTATQMFDQAELDALAQRAGAFNEANAITGLLVYNGLNFMQLIEGPDDRIEACMRRIVTDPRHKGVVTVSNRRVETREFPDWGMKAKLVPNGNKDALKRQISDIMQNVSDQVRIMFEGFSTLEAL